MNHNEIRIVKNGDAHIGTFSPFSMPVGNWSTFLGHQQIKESNLQ